MTVLCKDHGQQSPAPMSAAHGNIATMSTFNNEDTAMAAIETKLNTRRPVRAYRQPGVAHFDTCIVCHSFCLYLYVTSGSSIQAKRLYSVYSRSRS
jgi:hypothetical protein